MNKTLIKTFHNPEKIPFQHADVRLFPLKAVHKVRTLGKSFVIHIPRDWILGFNGSAKYGSLQLGICEGKYCILIRLNSGEQNDN